MKYGKFLTNPWTLVSGIIIGSLIGIFFKPAVQILAPIGNSYIAMLTLSILPMIFLAIILGISKILQIAELRAYLKILVFAFCLGIFIPSTVGILIGMSNHSYRQLSNQTQMQLGQLVKNTEYYPPEKQEKTKSSAIETILTSITPSHVVSVLTENLSVKTIVVALLIGIALGTCHHSPEFEQLSMLMVSVHTIFGKIYKWLITLLPIGMLAIFSSVVSSLNFSLLYALLSLMSSITSACIVVFIIHIGIIRFFTQESIVTILKQLKKPLITTFLVDSTIISIPAAVEACGNLKVNPQLSNAIFPIGIIINRHGNIILLTMISLFIAKFYYINISWQTIFIIWLLSTITSIGSIGAGASLGPILAITLHTITVPIVLAVLIITIVDTLLSRLFSTITISGNCALMSTIVDRKHKVYAYEK
ncbi:MAG: hypothetical protein A3C55_04720 [Gammaproteobacteria bacterium RIFCSPHIGHO2_02_FULL_42_13]|nr:MAG: hypothetical protein A3C55_04720 [Gammaproteobacteria bacterium RIFCSPHIGHO2_02_FULL_42_13]